MIEHYFTRLELIKHMKGFARFKKTQLGLEVAAPLTTTEAAEAIDKAVKEGELQTITVCGESLFIRNSYTTQDVIDVLKKGPATIKEITHHIGCEPQIVKAFISIGNSSANPMFHRLAGGVYLLLRDFEKEK